MTSDRRLLAYRDLDEALGLFNSASTVMSDKRTGCNIQRDKTNLLRLVLPGNIKHWSLRTLLVKLIKIGAKVLRQSRYVVFQMAECHNQGSICRDTNQDQSITMLFTAMSYFSM